MPTIEVQRRVAADPSSVALLLAGPSAVELWPGSEALRECSAGAQVAVDAPDRGRTDVVVQLRPPRRLTTSFVYEFAFDAPGVGSGTGSLTLTYAACPASTVGTRAVLRVEHDAGLRAGVLREMAAGFLENLAVTAERRASAA